MIISNTRKCLFDWNESSVIEMLPSIHFSLLLLKRENESIIFVILLHLQFLLLKMNQRLIPVGLPFPVEMWIWFENNNYMMYLNELQNESNCSFFCSLFSQLNSIIDVQWRKIRQPISDRHFTIFHIIAQHQY